MKFISTFAIAFGLVPFIAAAAVPVEGMEIFLRLFPAEVAFEGNYGGYGYGTAGQKDLDQADKKLANSAKKQANNNNADLNVVEEHTAANEKTKQNFENDVTNVQVDHNNDDYADDQNKNGEANKYYQKLDFPVKKGF
ncbi:hypothetical protein BDK51DRAFT_28272 [Blyttiomyces helicus]|uniref:Uncharacterized protein n=1 Tax=Blyttiomyces helicus TaxID=388810 RepID=A0A4V1IS52_9FUNG|nr:hypothetical protein BDK51DRAFT_28272 [Blyttiomyces helicus]|eukprot:RKO92347.1 hypothetical protein BDK51DRAFT_28272 [Blyttiomyces helicus]